MHIIALIRKLKKIVTNEIKCDKIKTIIARRVIPSGLVIAKADSKMIAKDRRYSIFRIIYVKSNNKSQITYAKIVK